jgi:hypothetical protein
MSHIAKRLVSAAASALVLTVMSTAAQAQTDVLTLVGSTTTEPNGVLAGVYTFNSSMILNSIGFLFNSSTTSTEGESYQINNDYYYRPASNPLNIYSAKDADGVIWLTVNRTVNAGDVLRVMTNERTTVGYTANSGTNVSYNGFNYGNPPPDVALSLTASRTNSNIRVTNPSSNVAPEPGSIALLLTGGGALAGIALRRRRNAA